MLTQLEKYVLTYEDSTGKIVCNIPDYYETYIAPLEGKYSRYTFKTNKTVICPLHNDTDPSLGLINHKFLPKVMLYHCFGCGKTGSIIRLHQVIQKKYYNRTLSDKESCLDLCKLFDIPEPLDNELDSGDYDKKVENWFKKIDKAQTKYTEKEFAENLKQLRKTGVTLDKVNSECVKMIATAKELYEWN